MRAAPRPPSPQRCSAVLVMVEALRSAAIPLRRTPAAALTTTARGGTGTSWQRRTGRQHRLWPRVTSPATLPAHIELTLDHTTAPSIIEDATLSSPRAGGQRGRTDPAGTHRRTRGVPKRQDVTWLRTRVGRQRSLPTKNGPAALPSATRAYQSDSSSKRPAPSVVSVLQLLTTLSST